MIPNLPKRFSSKHAVAVFSRRVCPPATSRSQREPANARARQGEFYTCYLLALSDSTQPDDRDAFSCVSPAERGVPLG